MAGTDPFAVVLAADSAIDYAASDMSKYVAERDLDALVYLDGEQPTVYWCRPLTLQERREVRNKASDADKYEAAFVRGLVRVERLLHDDGQRRDWVKTDDRSGKSKPIPDSALERYFDEGAVQEVGMVIWVRSFLARGSQGFYPLPDISRHALTASLYHRAARMSATSGSETSSEQAELSSPEAATPTP